MTRSAHQSIASFSIGQSVIRAIYVTPEKIYSSQIPTTKGDLALGLGTVTKNLEKESGVKVEPAKVVVSGSQSDLDSLHGRIEGELVTEDKAVAAAEQALTKKLGVPTAILDLGPSAFLDRYPAEEVGRWLPFTANLLDIENHLANKRLYPRSLPISEREYEIDLAVARQAIIKLGEREGRDFLPVETKMNLVLTGGLLTSIPTLTDLVSVVLDSFYFRSGVSVFVEGTGNLVSLGAILASGGEVELDLSQGFRQIGSMIHLGGAHKLTIDFGYQSKQRLALSAGEILVLPAEASHQIEVVVGSTQASHHFQLQGGEGGIYIDNRPRPLGLAASSKESIAKILGWRKALSHQGLFSETEAVS